MEKSSTQPCPDENFDRIQSFALAIADAERMNGRSEPKHGYTQSDWVRAAEMASFRLEPVQSSTWK